MKKIILIMSIVILNFEIFCIEDKIISLSTIKKDRTLLYETVSINDFQRSFIDTLVNISEGREIFIENEAHGFGDYIIEEDRFNYNIEKIDILFTQNSITYKNLLNDLINSDVDYNEHEKMIYPLYEEIDQLMIKRQEEINYEINNLDQFNKTLKDMVKIELIDIETKEIDYRDSVKLTFKMINNTSKTVEAVAFNIKLYNKLDEEMVSINCFSDNSFTTEAIGSWIFPDNYKNRSEYEALAYKTKDKILRTKSEVYKINLDGEILKEKTKYSILNLDYKTSDKLWGHSPYLDDSHPLKIEVKRIENEYASQSKSKYPVLNELKSIISEFVDFSL